MSKPLPPPEVRLREHLTFLYGAAAAEDLFPRLLARLRAFRTRSGAPPAPTRRTLTHRDALLITYGDQVQAPDEPPLRTLHRVLRAWAADVLPWVHLLPFFPYSSDDGFAVMDYTQVNPALGTWAHIQALAQDFDLMFDAVINHVSSRHPWFRRFLQGDPAYADFFITVPPDTDLSAVVRPRPWPLLTPFDTPRGRVWVWTTFSADQVDLNYHNPRVLEHVLEVLLFYVAHGAAMLRLDAIAYIWKEVGTSCIHLEGAHRLVKLLRAALDIAAPQVLLLTETNVPHAENIAYFGNGYDEAQLVYQFPLPPLVLHTFATGDATRLTAWAQQVRAPSPATTFLNFLASHDGIGVRPVEGILSPAEVDALVQRTLDHGGLVSYRSRSDGSRSVYELNISYFDALSAPQAAEPLALQVARFVAAHGIMFSLAGMPAVYVHSLFGSRGDPEAARRSGHPRAINRARFRYDRLTRELRSPTHRRARVYAGLRRLLLARRAQPAFHPQGGQQVLDAGPGAFVVWREPPPGAGGAPVLAVHSVRAEPQHLRVPLPASAPAGLWEDVLAAGAQAEVVAGHLTMSLAPYQVRWWRPASN